MKNIYLILLIALISVSCDLRKPSIDLVERTKMEIENPERHYYPILRGSELSAEFKIYNRGNAPLIIGFVEFYITILANTEKDVFTTIKFDLNVVTSAHYTQDYEEIYLERRKAKLAGEVDGDLTQQGYYTDDVKTVR